NISTRGFVRTGENVMIGGFILEGNNGTTRIVVRGIGPSLTPFGLNPVLADPTLELRDSNGATLVANDNLQDDPVSAAQLSAAGFALSDPQESGIFTSLPPGQFTAILAGQNGGIGIGDRIESRLGSHLRLPQTSPHTTKCLPELNLQKPYFPIQPSRRNTPELRPRALSEERALGAGPLLVRRQSIFAT